MGFRQFIDDIVEGGLVFGPEDRLINGINNTTDRIIDKGGKYAVTGGLVVSLLATPVLASGCLSQEDLDKAREEGRQAGVQEAQLDQLVLDMGEIKIQNKEIIEGMGEIKIQYGDIMEGVAEIKDDTGVIREDTKAIRTDTGEIKGNLGQFSGTFAEYLEEQAAAGIYPQSPYQFWPFGPQQIIQPSYTAGIWQDIANASRYSTDGSTARKWRSFEGTNEFNRLFGGWGTSVSHLFNGIDSDGEIKSGSGALYIDEIAGKAIFYLRNNRQPHVVDISAWDVKSSAIDFVIRYDTRVDNFKIHTMGIGYYGQ